MTTARIRRVASALAALVALFPTAPAQAAGANARPSEAADAASERGREAFEAGRFADARVAFQAALDALPAGHGGVPRTLYNLARAEQELGEHCAAAERFQRYLDSARPLGAAESKRAEKAESALTETRAACGALLEPVLGGGAVLAPAEAGEPEASLVAEPVEPVEPVEPGTGSGAEPWPWIAAGGAVLLVGGGVALNVLARGRVDDGDRAYTRFTDSGRRDAAAAARSSAAYDDARAYGTASLVGLGVGAALAGLSVWLF